MRTGVFLVALLASVAIGPVADAQAPPALSSFKVEWTKRRGRLWRPGIEGYVYNASDYRVGNVRLRVTTLDDSGKQLGEKKSWLYGAIEPGSRLSFVLPLPEPGQTYNIAVDSFDLLAHRPQTQTQSP